MAGCDLDRGFRLGEWLVEPQQLRISNRAESRPVPRHLMCLLLCLAARHGEVVDRDLLRTCTGQDDGISEHELAARIHALRDLLGDSAREPSYIVAVPHRGYALVAHFEARHAGSLEPLIDNSTAQGTGSLVVRAQHLLAELQRRHVLKVVGAYMVGMWIVLQVAETTFEPLHFPDWWMTALTILAVIGVPVIASLAWSYEITPVGVVLDSADTGSLPMPHARRAVAPLLVTGVALMAGVTGLAWWRSIATDGETRAAGSPELSLAVLPFASMTKDDPPEIGVGLSEDLTAQLTQIAGLHVASADDAARLGGESGDLERVGAALGVGHVLRGAVGRDGDRLKVDVELVEIERGERVWVESYDQPWLEVVSIHEEIAQSIATALDLRPAVGVNRASSPDDVVNLRAYEVYLSGVAALRSAGGLTQLDAARRLFLQALDVDPDFVRAHAGLCKAGIVMYQRTHASERAAEAEAHCRRALKLSGSMKETELALAALYLMSGRFEQAEIVSRGLAAAYPDDADPHARLGEALYGQGREEEAERSFRRAVELQPSDPGAHAALSRFLFNTGRPEEAERGYRKVVELQPGNASALSNLGATLMLQMRLVDAAAVFERSLALEDSASAHTNLGNAYYYLGRFEDALVQYERAAAFAPLDHQILGNVADAMWMIQARRAESAGTYAAAAGRAEERLKVNPREATTWAQLGYFRGRSGDPAGARDALIQARALGPEEFYVSYYAALNAADRDDPASADQDIARALELGYPAKLIDADPVLKSLLPRVAER
jgi:Flp pilus assembly protein TadD/TolB-like protein/DNA-binding winged helix-turn-helix (wHTH) protein